MNAAVRTVYRLVIPGLPLTMNAARRLHYYERAALDRQWREAGWAAAKEAGVPKLDAVLVKVWTEKKHRRSHDICAELPSAKAAIDGALIDAGVLPDDSPRYVQSLTFCAPLLGAGRDALVLEIEAA